MPAPNPLEESYSSRPPPVSAKTFHIAGILTTVYGLDELPPSVTSVSCLWLLHPRLQTQKSMVPVASGCINDWNRGNASNGRTGLVAISFDQRNHGSREVNAIANEAWRSGNKTHAQDMFSIYHGTAVDTSLLIDHIGSYILHGPDAPSIDQHLVLGVSLGGHAAWQVLFSDPRVTAGVVIIGCPDYMRVMADRARLSKLATYTSSNGAAFLGSKDFPSALITSVQRWDPKGILFGTSEVPPSAPEADQHRLRQLLDSKIRGKKFLICSGGADKLVPYHASEPFLKFLKDATGGWYQDGRVSVQDNVYKGVGHEFSPEMVKDAVRFVSETVAERESSGLGSGKTASPKM